MDSFHDAVKKNDIEKIESYIQSGGDIDIQTKNGFTALMYASERGYLETVKFLVSHGANVNIKNKYGETALICACIHGNLEIVKLLISNGANINLQNYSGETAVMYGNFEIKRYLTAFMIQRFYKSNKIRQVTRKIIQARATDHMYNINLDFYNINTNIPKEMARLIGSFI